MTTLVTALTLQQVGRLPEAEAIYRSIVAAEPRNVDALYLLGLLCRQTQEPESAAKWIRRAIAINDGVAQFHNHLGAALLDLGEIDEAKRCFARALQIEPRYADALLNLGNLLIRSGQDDEAATCYRAVLRLEPDHATAASNLQLALRHRTIAAAAQALA
jgi:tetratricopeptide (TPR) repeat protein